MITLNHDNWHSDLELIRSQGNIFLSRLIFRASASVHMEKRNKKSLLKRQCNRVCHTPNTAVASLRGWELSSRFYKFDIVQSVIFRGRIVVYDFWYYVTRYNGWHNIKSIKKWFNFSTGIWILKILYFVHGYTQ